MEGGNSFSGCHDMIALLENSNNSIWAPSSSSFPGIISVYFLYLIIFYEFPHKYRMIYIKFHS